MMPSLTIQPLIENAIEHGILKQVNGGTIHIQILDYDTFIEITVSDNGIGMDEETKKTIASQKAKNLYWGGSSEYGFTLKAALRSRASNQKSTKSGDIHII